MKGIKMLLASITVMLLAIVGVVGGGQGIFITYVAIPSSIVIMVIGLFINDEKANDTIQKNKQEKTDHSDKTE